MKKILIYILIFITLIEILNPINVVIATDNGNCLIVFGGDIVGQRQSNIQDKNTCIRTRGEVREVPPDPRNFDCFFGTQKLDNIGTRATCESAYGKWVVNCTPPEVSDNKLVPQCICPPPNIKNDSGQCVAPSVTQQPEPNMVYTFLAPLPELGPTFDASQTDSLSVYLNIMIKVFIGLCAVLAVIMIVVGGIEYMTSELPESKSNGKNRILGAIFGLVLAVGAWTILYTINPDLLRVEFNSLEDVKVTVNLMDEGENESDVAVNNNAPSEPTPECPEGITQASGISICGRLASNLSSMIEVAKTAGCQLSGGGYRSPESQKQLRIKNCNGDYTNRNASCSPATALPGASRHQQGLAVDFRSGGSLIKDTGSVCYKWLSQNAGTFGFRNLEIGREPWHWSIDGR